MQSNPFSFSGRHVFVAGGSSGINFGIAQAFAQAGARITLISRSADRVESAAGRLVADGAQALGLTADVRTPEAVESAMAQATTVFGPIDVLVSGAAGNFLARALDMSPRGFKAVVDIDLLGSFNVLRMAHPHLRKPGACVIQISASQASVATPYQTHVSAAKAGVDMLTRGLALEWGDDGIRINSVIPGPIQDTEGLRRLAPTQETRDAMTARVPLKRLGRLEDVSRICLVLASDWGSYITGAVVPVDGGLFLTGPRDFSAAAAATRRGDRP